jgi:hypothetical protein
MEVVNSPGLDQVRISHGDLDHLKQDALLPEQGLLVRGEEVRAIGDLLMGRRPWTQPLRVTARTFQVPKQRVAG